MSKYILVEKRLHGFEKWTTNSIRSDRSVVVQGSTASGVAIAGFCAFSHYVLQKTERTCIPTDGQGRPATGKNDAKGSTITDVAVHSLCRTLGGDTNMSGPGLLKFAHEHKCTAVCRALKLDPVLHTTTGLLYGQKITFVGGSVSSNDPLRACVYFLGADIIRLNDSAYNKSDFFVFSLSALTGHTTKKQIDKMLLKAVDKGVVLISDADLRKQIEQGPPWKTPQSCLEQWKTIVRQQQA
jgi:hypothetical protein